MKHFDLVNHAKRATNRITVYGNILTLTGTSGTANITINGYVNATIATFATSLTVTAANWVAANYNYYRAKGFIVSANAGVITVTPRYGWDTVNRIQVTIANATTNLSGTLAGTLQVDFAKARIWKVTFGQAITIAAPLNMKEGDRIRLELTAGGSYTTTWNAAWQFAGGTENVQTASGLDILEGQYDSVANKVYISSVVKDVKA